MTRRSEPVHTGSHSPDVYVTPPTERVIQADVLSYINAQNLNIWPNRKGRIQGRIVGLDADGSSDLIGITPLGKFFALELKAPGKKPKPEQMAFLLIVRANGGIGEWADSIADAITHIDRAFTPASPIH